MGAGFLKTDTALVGWLLILGARKFERNELQRCRLNQTRKQRQREKRKLALAVYAHRTQRIVQEMHPNQESVIERIETIAPQPLDLNTYGLKAALGIMLYRVWLYNPKDSLPATEYKLRRRACEPLVNDRERGIYLL